MNIRHSSILRTIALAAIIFGFHTPARAQVAFSTSDNVTSYIAPHHGDGPESKLDLNDTTCMGLHNKAYNYHNSHLWQMAYDTSKKSVEQCPHDYPDVTYAFIYMSEAIKQLGDYGQRRADYFAWLKSVLYLNTTDPEYFCACVEAMAGQLPVPPTVWPDTGFNYPLSVTQWLIQNTNCDSAYNRETYNNTRQVQWQMWRNNPLAYKIDTTLPTMQQLGLDSILAVHFKYAWVPSGEDFGKHVASYSVSENPLHEATTLRFAITDAEYVRVEVFDVLGAAARMAAPRDQAGLYPAGEHTLPIALAGLPSGTYYLRLSLGTGEVRTIKLVKE